MLPSMPLLMTPMKELADDSSDTSDDSPTPHHSSENGHIFITNAKEAMQIEQPNQTLVPNGSLPESNCKVDMQPGTDKVNDKPLTPDKRSLPEPSSAQKKKKKTQHRKTLAALKPESGVSLENSAQYFAEAYFQKVRSHLDEEKWGQFLQELVDFESQKEKNPASLYHRMEVLLSPHTELVDEFLAFLLPHQALQVNRFMTYLVLVKMKEFFRKLNILLMKRQARQVFAALETLVSRRHVTLADVKDTMLPLLKSSPLLTSHFLQLLPRERPPDSLMTDFEQVDLKDDSMFETIMVPDVPDPYGNENCICACHLSQKNRHCTSCGIKYLNGRVYLQYGKVLRPAKVTFNGNKHLDLCKWEEEKARSRRRFLPKNMFSPSCTDHRLNADSEDDCGVKKSPRTPRIRTAKTKVCKKGPSGSKEEEVLEGIFPLIEPKIVAVKNNLMGENIVDNEMKHDGNEEHDFDEVIMENECNTEEDEEEDLNKCLNSENDSSMEAEDINKELESGNDCSFEEEEMEDIENIEGVQIELSKESVVILRKSDQGLTLAQSFVNAARDDNTGNDKKIFINSENEFKEPCFEDRAYSAFPVKHIPESKSVIQSDGLLIIASDKINDRTNDDGITKIKSQTVPIAVINQSGDINEIKIEEEVQFMDVDSGQGTSSLKQEGESPSENETGEESVTSSGNVDSVKNASEEFKEWTREEDKIILQTFQHENGLEQTFETASLQLPNRSKEQIQERFEVLLKLLKEMISDESNSNP